MVPNKDSVAVSSVLRDGLGAAEPVEEGELLGLQEAGCVMVVAVAVVLGRSEAEWVGGKVKEKEWLWDPVKCMAVRVRVKPSLGEGERVWLREWLCRGGRDGVREVLSVRVSMREGVRDGDGGDRVLDRVAVPDCVPDADHVRVGRRVGEREAVKVAVGRPVGVRESVAEGLREGVEQEPLWQVTVAHSDGVTEDVRVDWEALRDAVEDRVEVADPEAVPAPEAVGVGVTEGVLADRVSVGMGRWVAVRLWERVWLADADGPVTEREPVGDQVRVGTTDAVVVGGPLRDPLGDCEGGLAVPLCTAVKLLLGPGEAEEVGVEDAEWVWLPERDGSVEVGRQVGLVEEVRVWLVVGCTVADRVNDERV